MRKALPRDKERTTVIPPYDKPIHVSKVHTTLSFVSSNECAYSGIYVIVCEWVYVIVCEWVYVIVCEWIYTTMCE